MTVDAGKLLVEEIIPRLRVAIPSAVKPIGAEDHEELIQDAIATAAMMLCSVEAAGKTVTPGNIAYYATLHTKSGRRSTGSSKLDIMAVGTRLSGRSVVYSLEEEIGFSEEFGGPVTLGEMLAGNYDDPAIAAARKLDWTEAVEDMDLRELEMMQDILHGNAVGLRLRKQGLTYESIRRLRRELAEKIRERLGETILADVARSPAWRANLISELEKTACKAERRFIHA